IDTKPNRELIHYCLENPPYELGWNNKHVLDSEGNPITTTARVFETYKNVEQKIRDQLNAEAEARFVTLVKQSQELKHISYHKLYDILKQHQHEVNEIQAEKIARNSSTRTHQAATKNRGKAVVNSPQPIYDQEPSMVDDDEDTSKDKEIDKLMALISLSFKKIYKPTNNNLRASSNTSRANQDNSP
nr:hypothetical protein [Tanacetum cinerariifolium]